MLFIFLSSEIQNIICCSTILNINMKHTYLFIYIYIYIYVCVCVCIDSRNCHLFFMYKNIYKKSKIIHQFFGILRFPFYNDSLSQNLFPQLPPFLKERRGRRTVCAYYRCYYYYYYYYYYYFYVILLQLGGSCILLIQYKEEKGQQDLGLVPLLFLSRR